MFKELLKVFWKLFIFLLCVIVEESDLLLLFNGRDKFKYILLLCILFFLLIDCEKLSW